MKRWQFILGITVSAVFIWLALRNIDLAKAWQALQTANYWWLVPAVAVYFVAVWARAWRWHYLLRPLKRIPVRAMFPTVVIGYMGNNIYPARIGELLRAYVLKRKENLPVSASLATVVIERVFDGVVMLGFVIFNLPALAAVSGDSGFVGNIQQAAIIGTIVFSVALAVFLLAALFPHQSLALFHRFAEPLIPGPFRQKVVGMVVSFWTGLESLRSPINIAMVFITSVVIWLLETVKYWFVMHAFSFAVPFFALMLMNGIVNLATTLPSAPGYVGTFDAPGIAVLTAYGVEGGLAASYTLVLHAALWLPITALGLYYFGKESLSWSNLETELADVRHEKAARL
ncbi:MAG: flippase-like domain-containing protein [Chloroflexi bacterium]|nr:flippase-like domain-containing protein [Chloroflexota bacterium]